MLKILILLAFRELADKNKFLKSHTGVGKVTASLKESL
jgi:hypothetical protein